MCNESMPPVRSREELVSLASQWDLLDAEYSAAISERDRRISAWIEKENSLFQAGYARLEERRNMQSERILSAIGEHPEWFEKGKRSCKTGAVRFGLRSVPGHCDVIDPDALRTYADTHNLPLYSCKIKGLDSAIRRQMELAGSVPGVVLRESTEQPFLKSER